MEDFLNRLIIDNNCYKELYKITKEIGPRMAGTLQEKMIAEHLERDFREYGLEANIQHHNYNGWANGYTEINWKNYNKKGVKKIKTYALGWTPNYNIETEIVNVGFGLENDYKDIDCQGKIVLLNAGFPKFQKPIHRSEKYKIAVDKGASGFLQYHDEAGGLIRTGSISLEAEIGKIPAHSISYEDGMSLYLAGETPRIEMITNIETKPIDSYNSIGYKKANTDTNEEIVVCGHIDCWFNSEGAYDNGSGLIMVKELARMFSKIKTKRNIRFIGFGSEELGLVGSKYYSETAKNIENIKAVFNLDVCATKNGIVQAAVNTKEFENLYNRVAEELKIDINITNDPGDHSDHYHFMKKGIPVSFLTSSSNYSKYAHTDYDTIEKLDNNCFKLPLLITGTCIYKLANSDMLLK